MFRSTNTCSVVPLPFICPSCSFLYITCHRLHFLSLSLIILNSIFPATESKVMPLQFFQFLVFPFFASLMISPCLQLLAIFSYCHIFFISWYIFSDENSMSALSYSAVMVSFPVLSHFIIPLSLPWLCLLLGCLLLSLLLCHGGHVSSRLSVIGFAGASLLSASLKC